MTEVAFTSVLIVAPPPLLDLDQAKLRAGLDWPAGDPRDALMEDFVATATSTVQIDTAFALLTQTRDVVAYGALPAEVVLPAQSRPLQSVDSITYVDDAGATQTVDPATYAVDLVRARIAIRSGSSWPVNASPFAAWTIRIVAGWEDVDSVPPKLVQAVGLLVAHLATAGRDLASVDAFTEVPYGYDDCIAPYRPVVCS